MTPTQRTLKALRDQGYLCAIVEKWNSHCRIRQDLFGFADLLAVKGDDVLLVQCCTTGDMPARIAKIEANKNAALWLEGQNRFIWVYGWAKRGARGKRKLWEAKVRSLMAMKLETCETPY